MNGDKKSNLCEEVRWEAITKAEIVDSALRRSAEEKVSVENVQVNRKKLIKFLDELERAIGAQNYEEMQENLKENTIPLDLLLFSNNWDHLQLLILKLHE